jgi:lysophospholipase L1-like esterase
MAFGDSITFGIDGDARNSAVSLPYPADLKAMLAARYVDQAIEVVNEGVPAETTTMGLNRFPGRLSAQNADLVLLEEGVNDLNAFGVSVAPQVSDNLRSMAKLARARGAQVLMTTLLPQRAGPPRNLVPSLVPVANGEIRAAARLEGVPVVDLYQAFGGRPDPYIGADNLHPNQNGYHRMAELFFEAIRAQFETSAPTFVTRR